MKIISVLILLLATNASAKRQPAPGDLSWGQQQMKQLLKDRPAMAAYVDSSGATQQLSESDAIYNYAVELFSSNQGHKVSWSNDQTGFKQKCSPANHLPATTPNANATIRLSAIKLCANPTDQPREFEELWVSLFFELFNLQNDGVMSRFVEQAAKAELSKCEFIEAITRSEYGVAKRTKDFFESTFAPWAKTHNYPSRAARWYGTLPATYELSEQQYTNLNNYPWNNYGSAYDKFILPQLQMRGLEAPTRNLPTPK